MATTALPSLSAKGWIDQLAEKADMLIAHFFASDSSQSQLYPVGEIANLPYLLYKNTNNIPRLQQDLRMSLENYLSRYYDNASVDVDNNYLSTGSGNLTMRLYIEVTTNGQVYSVANLLAVVNGKFEKITKINNTGKQ